MDARYHRELEQIAEWLLCKVPSDYMAQVGYANKGKRALIWLPGRRVATEENIMWGHGAADYAGMTQAVWKNWREPMQDQEGCKIAWLGFDVDLDSMEDQLRAIRIVRDIALPFSIRSSAGGSGLHLILRLSEPVDCASNNQGPTTRALCNPVYETLTDYGIKICSSGFRMFWLVGGLNTWLHQHDDFYESPVDLCSSSHHSSGRAPSGPAQFTACREFASHVNLWLERFHEAGCMRGARTGGNPVYVGAIIDVLREHGETVHTKSPCSGNGQVNGFIDISPDGSSISLWSYADGHSIWTWNEGCIVV